MHPNVFLKTFWRLELLPQIFVAMSFEARYRQRYDDVYAPAVSGIEVDGMRLKPHRVDLSKSGDAILTDIMDGIAHSQMVLADVSTLGRDSVTGHSYRNGNVMYEVGIALACRQPSEVLLVRDDEDKFLFDVSTVPHIKLDFANTEAARARLQEELVARLRERKYVDDARVRLAVATLSGDEVTLLMKVAAHQLWGVRDTGSVNFLAMEAIPRLLDKQLIVCVGKFEEGHPAYAATPLGQIVVKIVTDGKLRTFQNTLTAEDAPKTQNKE